MEPVTTTHAENRPVAGASRTAHSPSIDELDLNALRAELERLRERQAQIMILIGCNTPEKLLHDLRNVLNELQLLRMLAEPEK